MAWRHGSRGQHDEFVRITTAPESRTSDIDHRQRRYVISMTIRMICFAGGIIAGVGFDVEWLMWILIGASFLLPYVAVVMANSASPRIEGPDLTGIRHDELEAGRKEQGNRDR